MSGEAVIHEARIQIGARLARARIDRGLTQEQVARAIGMTRSSVANIEAGCQDVTLSRLLGFVRVTGANPSLLILPSDLWAITGRAS